MKKMIGVVLVTVMLSMVTFVANSFATDCGVMSVVSIASVETLQSGQVWLKNETGAACGTVAAGENGLYNLPPNTSDKAMALILTAISLNKKMWVSTSSDPTFDGNGNVTNPGMINILSMQN